MHNIKIDLQELGFGHVDCIGLAQDGDRWRTLVCAVVNLRVPWNAGNIMTSSTLLLTRTLLVDQDFNRLYPETLFYRFPRHVLCVCKQLPNEAR